MNPTIISAVISAIPNLIKIFRHEPYSNLISQYGQTLLNRASATGSCAIAYWHGELVGYCEQGNLITIGTKAETNALMETGAVAAYEQIVWAYVKGTGGRVDVLKTANDNLKREMDSLGIGYQQDGSWLVFKTNPVQSALSSIKSIIPFPIEYLWLGIIVAAVYYFMRKK